MVWRPARYRGVTRMAPHRARVDPNPYPNPIFLLIYETIYG